MLSDDRLNENGTLRGTAVFSPEDGELTYREAGRLTFGNYDDDVSRDYRYSFAEPGVAQVRFTDGQPFHDLDLRHGETNVRHLCGDDVYDGHFRANSLDSWTATWTVNGPRKSLRISSRYQRVP